MRKILFSGMDAFELENFQSIECKNVQEIESWVLKEKIDFILFPEEMSEIKEVVSSLKSFFFKNKLSVYPVFIQESNSVLYEHCGRWVIYRKKLIPKIIEQWRL